MGDDLAPRVVVPSGLKVEPLVPAIRPLAVDVLDGVIGPVALRHVGKGQVHRLVASVVDDDGVIGGVVQVKLRRSVLGDPGGLLELQLLRPLVEPVEVSPVVRVVPAQGGGDGSW